MVNDPPNNRDSMCLRDTPRPLRGSQKPERNDTAGQSMHGHMYIQPRAPVHALHQRHHDARTL